MNDKPSFSRRILYNDNLLKILSLVAAVIFWFIVVINVSPDYKHTFYGVAVGIDENSATLTSLGLHVVEKSPSAVSVVVTGPRNVIGALTADDFTVAPNISDISKAGSYELELTASLKVPDNRIKITKVNPANITVNFDTMVTKTLPVKVKVEESNVPDGYLMQTAQASPTEITLSGPTTELSQVSKAVAYVKVDDGATKTTVIKSDIVLLDSKDKELKLGHVQLSASAVQVTVPIMKTRDVKLKANFTNVPDGFDTSNIVYTVSPSTISLAGDEDKIDAMSGISLGDIDFTKLDLSTTQTLDIPVAEGIVNIENVTSAKVTVQLKNTSTRVMSTGTFTISNKPSGYTVTNETKNITNIKIFGPSSDIANVTGITAVIDMSAVQSGTGQYEVPVTFKVPGKTGYWVTGTYNAVVQVTK